MDVIKISVEEFLKTRGKKGNLYFRLNVNDKDTNSILPLCPGQKEAIMAILLSDGFLMAGLILDHTGKISYEFFHIPGERDYFRISPAGQAPLSAQNWLERIKKEIGLSGQP